MQLSLSDDAGRSFRAPRVVDGESPIGRVAVGIFDDRSVVVSWLARVDDGAELRVRRYPATGEPGPSMTVAKVSAMRSAGFPTLAAFGDRALIAWTAGGPKVEMAMLRLAEKR